jgi:hypothetical protein
VRGRKEINVEFRKARKFGCDCGRLILSLFKNAFITACYIVSHVRMSVNSEFGVLNYECGGKLSWPVLR